MQQAVPILLAVGISWLGLLVHNVADLPEQSVWSPETGYPTLVLLLFVLVWRIRARVGLVLLAGWSALHLLGGAVLSVLPLPVLPFDPEQTVRHYSFHVLYGLTQLPLLVLSVRGLVRRPADPG